MTAPKEAQASPSEKHMEAARHLALEFALPETEPRCAEAIAASLSEARQEGMREAAKIARYYPYTKIFGHHKNSAVACNASQNIADMIEGRLPFDLRILSSIEEA